MTNPDEEISKNKSSAVNRSDNGSSFIIGMNRMASGKSNWLRSIPKQIRKFMSKSNQRHSNKPIGLSSGTAIETVAISSQNAFESAHTNGNANATNETNSIIDYLDNDEEVAMICACSQMST